MLCMDLQDDGFSYAVVSKESKSIVHQKTILIEQFDRESITPLLTDEELTFDYDSLVATAGGERNTLMPVDLFNHSKADDIFKLNYPEPIDNLDYNRIPELGIVNIYELPLWMKSLFVIKFPRVRMVHPATVILKGVFNQKTWRPFIHVYMNRNSFYLLITAKDKLSYYNRFDYTNQADMIYHILFVLEQKEMEPKDMEVALYGVASNWEHKEELQGYFKNRIKVSDEKEQSDQFLLANQILCV